MGKDRSSSFRMIVAIFGIVAVSLIALFALRKAFGASSPPLTPTKAVAVIAQEPSKTDEPTATLDPTETPTLPATNTPKPKKTSVPQTNETIKSSRTPSSFRYNLHM
jgi:cytoskeletal protein RodZ